MKKALNIFKTKDIDKVEKQFVSCYCHLPVQKWSTKQFNDFPKITQGANWAGSPHRWGPFLDDRSIYFFFSVYIPESTSLIFALPRSQKNLHGLNRAKSQETVGHLIRCQASHLPKELRHCNSAQNVKSKKPLQASSWTLKIRLFLIYFSTN